MKLSSTEVAWSLFEQESTYVATHVLLRASHSLSVGRVGKIATADFSY